MITDEQQIKKLRFLFMLTYMVSYLTRINYGAVILEIGSATGIADSQLSLALTGSFLAYGIGQLVSGYFGDKIQPKKLVSIGLSVTVAMNILIPFCVYPWQMVAIWCVNGFAQSFLWPPIIRLMVQLFSEKAYKRATVVVSFGSSFGTIFIYLMSPLWIAIAGWKLVFAVSALCGLVMLLVWNRACPNIVEEPKEKSKAVVSGGIFTLLKSPLIWSIMFAIVLQGALRDGVTTWMPSYIAQTFQFSNGTSILTGVLLPLFSILCFQVTSMIYNKKPNNPLFCAGGIFLVGAMFAVLLLQFSGKNAIICILCMAILTGCMHGVNLILIGMLPAFFKHTGNVSMVSGLLNSCTYVGSAISTYGIAKISENAGWNVTIALWIGIAFAGTVLCFLGIRGWKRRFTA